jgi:hypothetical protein
MLVANLFPLIFLVSVADAEWTLQITQQQTNETKPAGNKPALWDTYIYILTVLSFVLNCAAN